MLLARISISRRIAMPAICDKHERCEKPGPFQESQRVANRETFLHRHAQQLQVVGERELLSEERENGGDDRCARCDHERPHRPAAEVREDKNRKEISRGMWLEI